MPTPQELIEQVESLPVEDRALIVDSLLKTLNTPDPERDRQWAEVAKRRLDELRSETVQPVSAEEVFAKAQKRFQK